ncbi:MAG: ABC transporter permease [Desulfobacterota bacterium]|jgi:lipooligosaccharide transport system permease protein|nr:ABC transporter permease [Thermodesulfobacteriota bacterium]
MKTGLQTISWRFLRIWQRNWDVYARTWRINFIPPILEPILYLVAFGAGLGYLVGEIPWEGRRIGYAAFIAPGLLSINIMQNSFFETTYTSFVRMYYQKTFDAILATPLNLEEIILGEIVWGATRSLMATAVMLVVLSFFGILSYPSALLILPVAFLGGLAFGAAGMCFTGIIPTIEVFNLPVFLFVTPMFLFSGTFFPLEQLPFWARAIAYGFPLTHIVELCRPAALGVYRSGQVWAVIYLSLFSMVTVPLALFLMRRRLIH